MSSGVRTCIEPRCEMHIYICKAMLLYDMLEDVNTGLRAGAPGNQRNNFSHRARAVMIY